MLLVDMDAVWSPTMIIVGCLLESLFLILEPAGWQGCRTT